MPLTVCTTVSKPRRDASDESDSKNTRSCANKPNDPNQTAGVGNAAASRISWSMSVDGAYSTPVWSPRGD